MISLRMFLLVSSIRRAFDFSLPSDVCRQRIPLSTLTLFGSVSRFTGVRHQTDCQLVATPSSSHGETNPMDDISWLSVKDSNSSYRLAYRRVLASTDGSTGHGTDASQTAVLFCNGFRSSMTGGTKAVALEDHCRQRGWEFCSFDYRGHGLSSGNFEDCTLTDWIRDASDILNHVLLPSKESQWSKKQVVLVGSSMGAWISIHLALRYNRSIFENNNKAPEYPQTMRLPIGGILGIAAGPDFLQDLYSSSTVEKQTEWRTNGVVHLPSRYGDPYPISFSLVKDAAQNWGILPSTKSISSTESPGPAINSVTELSVRCSVRLLHGKCDEDVTWMKSEELSNLLKVSKPAAAASKKINDDVILTLIEEGDHRLSRPQDIKLLLDTLDDMVTNL